MLQVHNYTDGSMSFPVKIMSLYVTRHNVADLSNQCLIFGDILTCYCINATRTVVFMGLWLEFRIAKAHTYKINNKGKHNKGNTNRIK
jgi:hypothetical protein